MGSLPCRFSMVKQLSQVDVRQLRFHHQALASTATDVVTIVSKLCGLQSQEWAAARLAIRARSSGLIAEDVRHSRQVERSVILTWTMRGTMHLVAAEDLPWQQDLFGTLFIRKTERRYQQLGLDKATREKAAELIQAALHKKGALHRADIAEAIGKHDIPVAGQAIHHLVRYAALAGMICFGPERDGELTYVTLDDWLGSQPTFHLSDEEALAELAKRYMQASAPATVHDLASWSGLPMKQVKAGLQTIKDDLIEVETADGVAWMLKQPIGPIDSDRIVRLLPRYDNYLLGHKSRSFMVEPEHARIIHPGGGLLRSCVIVDGQAQGVWRLEHKGDVSHVIVEPFTSFEDEVIPLLEAEAEDIGRFLDLNTQLVIR